MVAEDSHTAVARPETAQRLDEPFRVELLRRVAREVAGYGDEIGLLLVNPLDYAVQTLGLRPIVEMEVAELDDPVSVELRREPGQG